MLKEIKEECLKENIDITKYPITLDSWYVSKPLTEQLYERGNMADMGCTQHN